MPSILTWLSSLLRASGNAALIRDILCAAGIAAAVLNVFFGYRLARFWSVVFGAAVGAAAGYAVGGLFSTSLAVEIGALIAGAVIVALLFRRFFRFAVCVMLGVCTYLLMSELLPQWPAAAAYGPSFILAVSVAAGIAAAILTRIAWKVIIILCTAAGGSYTTVSTAVALFALHPSLNLYRGIILGLAAAGMLVQFIRNRR